MRRFSWAHVPLLVALVACAGAADDEPGAGAGAGPPEHVKCEAEESAIFGDDVALACELCGTRGRCIGGGRCLCFEGYEGPRCEACAEGYLERGGNCVTPCTSAGVPCRGLCTGTEAEPTCECEVGYEGADCERCAEGFERSAGAHTARCEPTCGGTCAGDEVCVATAREEQSCACMPSYERSDDGACVWREPLADPRFERACDSWALEKVLADTSHDANARIVGSELRMHVTHRCSGASASTEVALPAPHTVANAALVVTANGAVSSTLNVDFGGGPPPFFTEGERIRLTGMGRWERYIVCVPPSEAGQKTVLRLSVGTGGQCGAPASSTFSVRSIEIASEPTCQ